MSSDDSGGRGLSDVSQRELGELIRALDAGWLTCPLTDLGLSQAGLSSRHCAAIASVLAGLDRAAVRAALQVALAERVHRPPPYLDLVWTGPEARGTNARDTSILVRQLFEHAERSVIIAGFRFDGCAALFTPLHQRMSAGLSVSMFTDIEGDAPGAIAAKAHAERYIQQLLHDNWPFGPPYPNVYYDLRSAITGPPWISLHAKCIVVDETHSFITSANFTGRGQTRNIEVGVGIDDRDFGERLSSHFRTLVARQLVEQFDMDAMGAKREKTPYV